MRGDSDPTGALLLGMGAGVLMFYRGFKRFREYKVLADTPRIPIRSMPMGLVHIRGKAQGDQLVRSPLTGTECCFYKVVVERWKTEEHSGNWEHHCDDREGIKFYLQDESGQVLIDSYSAEYDLPESAVRVVDSSRVGASQLLAAGSATDADLLQYVSKAEGHRVLQWAEHKLEQKGTLTDPRKEQARLHLMELMQAGLNFQREGKLPVDLIERMVESRGPLADPQHEQARQAFLAHLRETGTLPAEMMPNANLGSASGRYRLHEYVIVPGRDYFVTGTCVENPAPRDAHDRNLIQQGGNETTFVVSSRPEEVAEKSMRGGAFKMILGGAALALACLAGLLLRFKMF